MKGLYVYALVPAGFDASPGTGLADEPLRTIPLGAIDAVVGEMEDRPSIAPPSLRAHDEVVRGIGRASDAILPMRFGAMVLDAGELREGLGPRVPALAASLERTRGCDQLTLRLYAPGAGATAPAPELPAGPGTRWLRARSAHAAIPELARVREALSSLVRAESIETHDAPPLRASVFHLVPRAALGDYRARVESLAVAMPAARVVATGPWPPYAFTELE